MVDFVVGHEGEVGKIEDREVVKQEEEGDEKGGGEGGGVKRVVERIEEGKEKRREESQKNGNGGAPFVERA